MAPQHPKKLTMTTRQLMTMMRMEAVLKTLMTMSPASVSVESAIEIRSESTPPSMYAMTEKVSIIMPRA